MKKPRNISKNINSIIPIISFDSLFNLKWNEETGHYDFGDLPWDEFMEILKGNGPCNKKRLETKRKAQAENAWVKEAAIAYAAKQENLKKNKIL